MAPATRFETLHKTLQQQPQTITTSPTSSLMNSSNTAVPQNSSGGIMVTQSELEQSMQFFDPENSGKIMYSTLRKKLQTFYPNITSKEVKFLMGNKNEMAISELSELLKNNTIQNYDPVAEAFKVYDPNGTGHIDAAILRRVFQSLGFGEITDDNLNVLIETGDLDADGVISLEDFRKMVNFGGASSEKDGPGAVSVEDVRKVDAAVSAFGMGGKS